MSEIATTAQRLKQLMNEQNLKQEDLTYLQDAQCVGR